MGLTNLALIGGCKESVGLLLALGLHVLEVELNRRRHLRRLGVVTRTGDVQFRGSARRLLIDDLALPLFEKLLQDTDGD